MLRNAIKTVAMSSPLWFKCKEHILEKYESRRDKLLTCSHLPEGVKVEHPTDTEPDLQSYKMTAQPREHISEKYESRRDRRDKLLTFSHLPEGLKVEHPTDTEPDLQSYKMTAQPRGVCVIIANDTFERSPPIQTKEIDQKKLETEFRKLGFIVKVFWNLTANDMGVVMRNLSQVDHSTYDACVVCILSHGGTHSVRTKDDKEVQINGYYVSGVDNKLISINDLQSFFRASSCKTLVNKPKLFFFDACLGHQRDVIVNGPPEAETVDTDVESSSLQQKEPDDSPLGLDNGNISPNESDFLLGYSTVFGYRSYHSSIGSFYIRSLTNNLNRYASTLDLEQIMIKVRHDVAEEIIHVDKGAGIYTKQTPMTNSTLRKQLFFSPNNLKSIPKSDDP